MTRGMFARLVATVLAATALLLAACNQQPPPEEPLPDPPDPALELTLDQEAVEVLKGATVLVDVTLSRTGTVTEPVVLSLEGSLPPGVSATFDPATLAGSEEASTLTIAAESATPEATIELEVAAEAGELATRNPLSVEVVGLTVVGRVEDNYGQPLPGGRAGSQGKFAVIGSDGTFTLNGLSVPYDLMVGSGLDRRLHLFEGLTDPEPVLVPFDVIWEPTGMAISMIEGALLAGDPLGPNELVLVCVEGHEIVIFNCATASSGEDRYEFQPVWYDVAAQEATIHAIHYETGADDETVAFHGYDQLQVTLVNGSSVTWDIEFEPIGTSFLEGRVARGSGTDPNSLLTLGSVRFGETLAMLVNGVANEPEFALLMPDLPSTSSGTGRYDLMFVDGFLKSEVSVARRTGLEENPGTVQLLDVPQVSGPANGASGVSFTTPFAVSGLEGEVKMFTWAGANFAGPMIALTTTRDSVTIPDPAALGLGGMLQPYHSMYWGVSSSMHPDTDSATEEVRAITAFGMSLSGIAPLPPTDARYALVTQQEFGFGTPP